MKNIIRFGNYLKENNYADSTVQINCRDVLIYNDWLIKQNKKIRNATPKDAIQYVKFLKQRKVQPQTQNQYLNSLKHYYNFLKVKRNPFRNIEVRGRKKTIITNTLTSQRLEELYLNFPTETPVQKRNKVILGLYVFQGLSSSEPDRLEVKHVDLKTATVTIPACLRRDERTLKLTTLQLFDLHEYLKETRPSLIQMSIKTNGKVKKETEKIEQTDRLFFTLYNNKDLKNLRVEIREQLKKQSKKFKDIPQLRISLIVNWLKNEHLRKVMYKAGHRYVSSTQYYQINDISKLQEAVFLNHPLQ